MKKTITKNDGSVEVIEGTAEEIAAYEKRLKGEVQTEAPEKKGPGLLTEEDKHYFNTPFFQIPPLVFTSIPRHSQSCEVTTAMRGWLSINPPTCTCGADPYRSPYQITYTITSDSINVSKLS